MSSVQLREQVAQAIRRADARHATDPSSIAHAEDRSDAAIRVVLAAVTEGVEAMPSQTGKVGPQWAGGWVMRDDVLALVARLGEEDAPNG